MAKLFKDKYNITSPVLADVYPQNKFDESFGLWPDNMVAFQGKKK